MPVLIIEQDPISKKVLIDDIESKIKIEKELCINGSTVIAIENRPYPTTHHIDKY